MVLLMIGPLITLYRRSPFYPSLGSFLARLLGMVLSLRREKIVRKEIEGIRYELDLSEVIDSSLYFSGAFEPNVGRVAASLLRPGMIALDVGANIGAHTFPMARLVGPGGRLLAFEPTAAAFARLERNASLNRFGNLTLLRIGLTDRDLGVVEVELQSSFPLNGRVRKTREPVLLQTLDTALSDAGILRVDFIKIDVDGYEARVLRGARGTLERSRPHLLFELYPVGIRRNGDDPQELVRLLEGLDYVFRLDTGEAVPDLAARVAALRDGQSLNLLASPRECPVGSPE